MIHFSLYFIQDLKQTRYRFKIVVGELDAPETPIEYQVALLSFVNCIIISTQGLQDRLRVRNEFIGKFLKRNILIDFNDQFA